MEIEGFTYIVGTKAVSEVTLAHGETLTLDVKFTNSGDKSLSLAADAAKATLVDVDGAAVSAATTLNSGALVVLPGKSVTFDTSVSEAGLAIGKYTLLVTIPDGTETIESTLEIEVIASDDATLSDLTVGGTTVSGFDADTTEYTVVIVSTSTGAGPTVAATANSANADSVVVTQATDVEGTLAERTATVVVTAEDEETTKTYKVVFVINNAPTVANPLADITPAHADGNVVIDLSDVFADADSDELTYSVSVTNGTDITSAVVNGTDLIIVPAGTTGTQATVTVTASDGIVADNVTDSFTVDFQ